MNYSELCDAVLNHLISKSAEIEVPEGSIVEGGKPTIAPAVHVIIEPILTESSENGRLSHVSCGVAFMCLAPANTDNGSSRREAMALASRVYVAMKDCKALNNWTDVMFSHDFADYTLAAISSQSYFSL